MRAVLLAAGLALAAAGSAGAGSGPDKAGGRAAPRQPVGKPVVLTLQTGDPPFAEAYAATVGRLSGGAIRIEVRLGRTAQRNYERFTVEDVRKGKAQLGSVAARVWDTMGVPSMRALVAPLLVDSLTLQRQVLESPFAAQMLAGLDRTGVVGLALTPGPLRRPFGVTRPLRGPQDYRGATIGIKSGGVARSTFEALGAKVTGYTLGQAFFDGAELDLKTIADTEYDPHAKEITANVVFWPRPQTVFANRAAFAKLTPAQREILRRAGREAVRAEAERIEKEESDALSVICSRSPGMLVTASASEIAALRTALRPVYAELGRDPGTRKLIGAIRKLRSAESPGAPGLRCPGATGAAALEGRWRSTVSSEEMLARGASAAEAAAYSGTGMLELSGGTWLFRGGHGNIAGTYRVDGDHVELVMRTCTANPCSPGAKTVYRWSVYRDTLSLVQASVSTWPRLVAKPATRVR